MSQGLFIEGKPFKPFKTIGTAGTFSTSATSGFLAAAHLPRHLAAVRLDEFTGNE
jgi:hypothetical protein